MVKRLRHRPFTAVTGVRIPLGSFNLIWRRSQVVRHGSATPSPPVRIRSSPLILTSEGIRGFFGSLSIVGVGVVKIPPQITETMWHWVYQKMWQHIIFPKEQVLQMEKSRFMVEIHSICPQIYYWQAVMLPVTYMVLSERHGEHWCWQPEFPKQRDIKK